MIPVALEPDRGFRALRSEEGLKVVSPQMVRSDLTRLMRAVPGLCPTDGQNPDRTGGKHRRRSDRSPALVDTLVDRGFVVHTIHPKRLDRLRGRFSVAGCQG